MKTNRYLAILILISLLINVGLGWYVLDLSRQIDQQKTDYYVLNTNNQITNHLSFLLLKDDILRGSSILLNQSVNELNIGGHEDIYKEDVIFKIDQVLASFRYFSFSAGRLGSAYINMSNYIDTPKLNMLQNLADVRKSVFYGNYTQNDIDYLQHVANNLNTVADNLLETGVGQFSISDIDAVVVAFYDIESMTAS